ncbi:universal stress protein [Limimaricola sp.]|uniref:universal stress protein n=1 Tax=Limimaricola sp. TaxID=2211665 RepID=UPI0040589293
MYRKILIPVALDHEGLLDRKIATARALLEAGGQIRLLTVLEAVPGFVAEFVDKTSENKLSDKVRARLEQQTGKAPDMTVEVVTGKPGLRITQYAREHDMDLIVVGSRQPGIEDYFLGSTAARVARRAHCGVLILR